MTPDETIQDQDKLMTAQEMAARLNLNVWTFRRLVRRLGIPRVSMSHQLVRYHYPTVLKFLKDRKH